MEERVFDGLKYLISFPKGFHEEQKIYPLIIFLHGAGTRSETTERLRKNACVVNLLGRQNIRGYILLAPLCERGNWYEWMTILTRLIEAYRDKEYIDKTRLYITGNSMGGYGTWALVILHPEWFAAAMPICGGGIGGFAKNLVDVPIRTFHGLRDTTVDPIESLQMVKAVNLQGGHAELILYPKLDHNCWDAVYSDESNYDWLLSFTAEGKKTLVNEFSGTKFG